MGRDSHTDPVGNGLEKVAEIIEVIDECDVVEVVDIEIFAPMNQKPPRAKSYRIRIDKQYELVVKRHIDGTEILKLVGKAPDKWRLHQKLHGGVMMEIAPEQVVDLGERGIERFVTMETCQTDGEQALADAGACVADEAPPRRDFRLPEEDEDYLNGVCDRWETIIDGGGRWVLIYCQDVPPGFNQGKVIMAIRIEGGYPPSMLDMVYFFPPLARQDGCAIPALSTQAINGVTYQRWSRHYPWREGVDNLATHHIRASKWLSDELKR